MPDFRLPDLGEGVTEAEVDRWLVAEGDEIAEDAPLVEVITDKATAEIPSPFGGVVTRIHVQPGQVVPVGTVLVSIGGDAEEAASPPVAEASPAAEDPPAAQAPPVAEAPPVAAPSPQPAGTAAEPAAAADPAPPPPSRESTEPVAASPPEAEAAEPVFSEAQPEVKATPPVRKLARELGVEITAIRGSGPGGRILREDVEAQAEIAARFRAAGSRSQWPEQRPAAPTPDAPPATPQDPGAPVSAEAAPVPENPDVAAPQEPVPAEVAARPPVQADAAAGATAASSADPPAPEPPSETPPPPPPVSVTPASEPAEEAVAGTRVPLRGVRRTIAERMSHSHTAIPSVTHVEECDVTDLDASRRATNEQAATAQKLTFLPYIVKAVAARLRSFPALNASLDEEAGEIVYHDRYDIGVAVDTAAGLIVPVVRNADRLSVFEIAAEIDRIAAAARDGHLSLDELQGGTFTVTSPGPFGGLMATPIILHPQAAILGVHRATERAVVREGQIAVRLMMNLSITFDHRILDGVMAARFLLAVVRSLETPDSLMA